MKTCVNAYSAIEPVLREGMTAGELGRLLLARLGFSEEAYRLITSRPEPSWVPVRERLRHGLLLVKFGSPEHLRATGGAEEVVR